MPGVFRIKTEALTQKDRAGQTGCGKRKKNGRPEPGKLYLAAEEERKGRAAAKDAGRGTLEMGGSKRPDISI